MLMLPILNHYEINYYNGSFLPENFLNLRCSNIDILLLLPGEKKISDYSGKKCNWDIILWFSCNL